MADLSPDEAIEKLRALPEDRQRKILSALSPEQKKGILAKLRVPATAKTAPPQEGFLQRTQEGKVPPDLGTTPYKELGAPSRAAVSFSEGFGIPQSVQEHPSEAAAGIGLAAMHPGLEVDALKQMWNGMNEQQQKLIDEAFTKQHMPGLSNKAEGFVLGIYSAIPVFGPAIVNAVRQYQSGDKAGAAGSFAAIVAQVARPGEAKVATEPVMGEAGATGRVPAPKGSRLRSLAQGVTGAGPEATTEPMLEQHRAKVADVEAANRAKTEEAFERGGKRKASYEERVKNQEADYAKSVNEATAFNAEQAQVTQRKAALEKQVDTESADLGKDITALENAVYREANNKFNGVKAKVGNATTQPDGLISTVKDIEKNVLQGIPENVKEFRSILSLEGTSEDMAQLRQDVMKGQGMTGSYEQLSPERQALVDDIAKKYGGQINPNEPIGWDKLQSLKSRIDQRLRGRVRMNGDLKRGLFQLRDAVVDEMGNLAVPKGAGPDWDAARDFYRQWKEDFHEPTGPSGSGSPVAQALNAVDPANIRKPFTSKQTSIGNRGVDTLKKYAQFGGAQIADKASKLVSSDNELGNLKPKAKKPIPERPRPVAKPKPVEAKLAEKPAAPTAEDVSALKRKKIRDAAVSWGKFHTYDLGILANSVIGAALFGRWEPLIADPLFVAVRKSAAIPLKSAAVREWIARPLPEELQALQGMPDELKADARKVINKAIDENGTRDINPGLKAFLAGTRVSGQSKPPGEQLKDLRSIQERHGSNPSIPIGPE
jgi:hypothetical protein